MNNPESITVTIPRKAGLVFQVQNIPGTSVWAAVEKGDLIELIEKARLYDMESNDRLVYEADRLSRQFALEHPVSLGDMVEADFNSKSTGVRRQSGRVVIATPKREVSSD